MNTISELMIGDWVNIEDGKGIVVVTTIHGDNIIYTKAENWYEHIPVYAKEVKPIPLTPEFFEKNFEKEETFELSAKLYGNDLWLIELHTDKTTIVSVINYVHELQHMLRFCGIRKEVKV